MKNKQWPFYSSLIIGISLGILGIYIFTKLPNKNHNDWIGIIGAMLSLLGIILSIKSFINLKTYSDSINYIKIDSKLKKIKSNVPEITKFVLEIKNQIQNSRGKNTTELDLIKNNITDLCNKLTALLADVNLYNKEYEVFLQYGKNENVTKILSNWNSGVDKDCMDALQYIHENLLKTINNIIDKNKDKIDPTLKGILY